jgi:D-sedoheptulose 7-phosphate isomerase
MDDGRYSRRYLDRLAELLGALDETAIAAVVARLRRARDEARTIFICGNGGSASIASEMVVDLVKGASLRRPQRFKMMALTDSIATITAYANDEGYETVFVEPLRNFAASGDVLIAISGSGNSENVLAAVRYANEVGCTTIGLTTGTGGALKDLIELPLLIPESHMGRLEDCFYILTHVIAYAFIDRPDDVPGH